MSKGKGRLTDGDRAWLVNHTGWAPSDGLSATPRVRVVNLDYCGDKYRLANRYSVVIEATGELFRNVHEDNLVRSDPGKRARVPSPSTAPQAESLFELG